jgi:hypothetical protein
MKRKYYRKCGYCGKRFEQKFMVRTGVVKGGWLCKECYCSEEPYFNFITDSEDLQLCADAEDF